MTCHKAIRTDLFALARAARARLRIEPEITARLLRAASGSSRCRSLRARSREEGKKLTAMDGVRVVATLVRERLRR